MKKTVGNQFRTGTKMAPKGNIPQLDDDLAVRQSRGQALTVENCNVVTAPNGDKALREFDWNSIELVLLDVNLGKESGWDPFQRLTQIQPFLQVIVMTAHPDENAPRPARCADTAMESPLIRRFCSGRMVHQLGQHCGHTAIPQLTPTFRSQRIKVFGSRPFAKPLFASEVSKNACFALWTNSPLIALKSATFVLTSYASLR
jgi:CheY-like chemotaxis protein